MYDIDALKKIQDFPDKLQGYVYVIDNGNNIKIGCTSNLYKRMHSLSNSNSGGNFLENVFYSPPSAVYKTVEKIMKKHFEQYNITGEWYSGISYEEVVKYLQELCNSPGFENCSEIRKIYKIQHKRRKKKAC